MQIGKKLDKMFVSDQYDENILVVSKSFLPRVEIVSLYIICGRMHMNISNLAS